MIGPVDFSKVKVGDTILLRAEVLSLDVADTAFPVMVRGEAGPTYWPALHQIAGHEPASLKVGDVVIDDDGEVLEIAAPRRRWAEGDEYVTWSPRSGYVDRVAETIDPLPRVDPTPTRPPGPAFPHGLVGGALRGHASYQAANPLRR